MTRTSHNSIALAVSCIVVCCALCLTTLSVPALAQQRTATFGGSDGTTGPTFPRSHSAELIVPDAVVAPLPKSDNVAQAPVAGAEQPAQPIDVQRRQKERPLHVEP